MMKRWILAAALFGASLAMAGPALAVGTGFTWQGELRESGAPATGTYDIEFRLYATANGGTPLGPVQSLPAQAIGAGLFSALLDFGDQFTGDPRWLEIAVRRSGQPAFTTLSPRQPLTATPYAQHADFVADNSIVGANIVDGSIGGADLGVASVSSAQIQNGGVASADLADGSVTTPKIAPGAVSAGKLQDGAVGTLALADAAVTGAKLAPGAVGIAQVNPGQVQQRIAARCPTELPMIGVNVDGTPVCGSVSHRLPGEGTQPKLALRSDGRPVIAFVDDSGDDLKLAICGDPVCATVVVKTLDSNAGSLFLDHDLVIRGSGIASIAWRDSIADVLAITDCGDQNCDSPTTYLIDTASGAGQGVSIALRTGSVPVVSYFVDAATDELRLFDCANAACTTGSIRTLDTTNLNLNSATAVVVPPSDIPVVFFEGTGAEQGLNASLCGNSDCVAAGTQNLTTDSIANLAATVGANGSPLVAFRRNVTGAILVFDCGGIVCSQGDLAIAFASSDLGRVDIALAGDGTPYVSAYVTDRLRVYDCDSEACISGTSRSPDLISGRGAHSSLAVRDDGRPVLAYEDNGRIRITVCGNEGCVP